MAEEEKTEEKPGRSISMGLIIALVGCLVNLGGLGYGAFLVYSSTIGYSYKKLTEDEAQRELAAAREAQEFQPIIFTMEPITANLSGQPKRMVRLQINLEMLSEKGFEDVATLASGAKDEVLKLLNKKHMSDLETIQGKLFLKDQIALTINGYLQKGVVKNVYFTDFVIQ